MVETQEGPQEPKSVQTVDITHGMWVQDVHGVDMETMMAY